MPAVFEEAADLGGPAYAGQPAAEVRDGAEVDLPVEEVRHGDVVLVRPGERIPVDGEVISGTSASKRVLPVSRSSLKAPTNSNPFVRFNSGEAAENRPELLITHG